MTLADTIRADFADELRQALDLVFQIEADWLAAVGPISRATAANFVVLGLRKVATIITSAADLCRPDDLSLSDVDRQVVEAALALPGMDATRLRDFWGRLAGGEL